MAAEKTRNMGGGASAPSGVLTRGAFPRVPTQNSSNDVGFEDSPYRSIEVSITSAQLLALRATPVEVIPAVTGKIIQFIAAHLQMIFGTVAYTENSGTCNLGFKYTNGSGVQVNETVEATGFVDQVVNAYTQARQKLDPIVLSAGCLSQALVLQNVGSAEMITGDGVLKIKILYAVQSAT